MSSVKCPQCSSEMDVSHLMKQEVEAQVRQQLNQQTAEWKKRKEEEYAREAQTLKNQLAQQESIARRRDEERKAAESKKEAELTRLQKCVEENDRLQKHAVEEAEARVQQRIQAEQEAKLAAEKERLMKTLQDDFSNQIQVQKERAEEAAVKLKEAREKELEYLRREDLLRKEKESAEFEMKRQMMAERERLAAEIKEEERNNRARLETEHQMQIRTLEERLKQQVAAAEEMKRKAEQGSMQLQGEVQELILQELLGQCYLQDKISEVAKGVKGADCIQTVVTGYGQPAGKIIYESKRTSAFNKEWIDKLRADMIGQGADIAVIVTQAMPLDLPRFGQKDGVYICSFHEVKSVSMVLRNALLLCHEVRNAQQGKTDKMSLLYDYLTSSEFGLQWKMVSDMFMQMKNSIAQEKAAMEKLWKAREKQLETAISSTARIQGSIVGIAGHNDPAAELMDDAVRALEAAAAV